MENQRKIILKYFFTTYTGDFTIGDEDKTVDGDAEPTLIVVPGNVPHRIHNPYDKKRVLNIFN